MLNDVNGPGLIQKSGCVLLVLSKLLVHNFDCSTATNLAVLRFIDNPHATFADFPHGLEIPKHQACVGVG